MLDYEKRYYWAKFIRKHTFRRMSPVLQAHVCGSDEKRVCYFECQVYSLN